MPEHLLFDIETNTNDLTRTDLCIHCVVIADLDTDTLEKYTPGQISQAIERLSRADRLIGHYIVGFDLPVIERLYPEIALTTEYFDTLMCARMVYVNEKSYRFAQSLGDWGKRLGFEKKFADVDSDFFESYSEELLERCISDVEINIALYKHLLTTPMKPGWPVNSMESFLCESKVGYILARQERNGIGFNVEKAKELEQTLEIRRQELKGELQDEFGIFVKAKTGQKGESPETEELIENTEGDFACYTVPKRTATRRKNEPWPVSVMEGCPYTQIVYHQFNPASPDHRVYCLQKYYGWVPTKFTDKGQPVTDEFTLKSLDYPPVKKLVEFMVVNKRLGQLADGKNAWLKVEKDGIIHGRILNVGARTNRCAHYGPNLGQIPKMSSLYGPESRELFEPTKVGFVVVGADASSLQLRCLASRIAKWDPDFVNTVVSGDIHSKWQDETGMIDDRDDQKTFNYALLFGAGNHKLGTIVIENMRKRGKAVVRTALSYGGEARGNLLQNNPAFEKLLRQLKIAFKRGYIVGLDGRIIACRTDYGTLNDLLQGDEAVIMKHALIHCWEHMEEYAPIDSVFPMLFIHDEFQNEAELQYAEAVGQCMVDSIKEMTNKFNLQCPLDAEFKVGESWAETH